MFTKFLSAVPKWSLYALAVLLPIFFLPFTADALELPKQYLMYLLIGIGFVAWLLRGFLGRKIEIKRTPADLALVALWVLVLISSIFSKDRTVSFFGSYDQLTFGFVPLTFYLLAYFLIVQSVVSRAQIARLARLLSFGIAISAIYFWLKTAGVIPAYGFLPQWNLTALTNGRFGMLLAVPLATGFSGLLTATARKERIFWGAVAAIAFVTMLAIGHTAVLILGAIALGLIALFGVSDRAHEKPAVVSVMLAVLLIFALFAIFKGLRILTPTALPAEITLASLTSWKIAWNALMENIGRALIGSGPATFAYDFSAFRPESFNLNLLWSLRFSAPFSEAAGLVAILGIIGVLPFVFLALIVGAVVIRRAGSAKGAQSDDSYRHWAAIWGVLLAALFVASFGTVFWFAFFALLACATVSHALAARGEMRVWKKSFADSPHAITASFGMLALLVAFLVLGVYLGRFYAAETVFAKGLRQGARQDFSAAISHVARAADLNSQSPRYYLALTQLQFQAALAESRGEAPDADKVGSYVVGAVQNARRATELAPNSAAAWERLGTMYAQVSGLAPEARLWAADAFSRAITLEPSNPVFYLWRGQLSLAQDKKEDAERDFKRAIELKPNYLEAYIVHAAFKEQGGDRDGAVEVLEQALAYGSGNMEFLLQLARAYVNRDGADDQTKAERILNALIARNPDYANARFILGTLYEKQGKAADALREFRKVEELNPDNADVKAKIKGVGGEAIENSPN